jgi:hypothetical protein
MAINGNTALSAATLRITTEQHIEYMKYLTDLMIQIATSKGADYTAGSGDPFANFRLTESLGITTVEAGILVRMTDKFARLTNLTSGRKLQVREETLEDTLLDLANYALILRSYLYHQSRPREVTRASV